MGLSKHSGAKKQARPRPAFTVLVDLTVAIGVGVSLASLIFMARMSETVTVTAGGLGEEEDVEQRKALPEGVEVFRISGPFFFGVASELLETLTRMGRIPRRIILRLELVPYLDASGSAALGDFIRQAAARETRVTLSAPQPQPLAVLERALLGPGSPLVDHAPDFQAALASARE